MAEKGAKDDFLLLDALAKNIDSPSVELGLKELGYSDLERGKQDLRLWKFAKDNPSHERAAEAKNSVLDSIASGRPVIQEQGVSKLTRFGLKNLIGEEPKLQVEYLKKKGFDSKIIDGQVVVKKPGETQYKVVDPSGIDPQDFTDLFGDAVETIADTIGTGAKFLGLIGAPATGGGSLVAGLATGAAISGGAETARQGLAKATGFREEFDKGRIGEKAALGLVVPLALRGAGKALSKTSEGIKSTSAALFKRAKNADEVIEAGKKLGVKPSVGQLYDREIVKNFQSSVEQSPTLTAHIFGGPATAAEKSRNALREAGAEVIKEASELGARTTTNIGDSVIGGLSKAVKSKVKQAEDIYDKLSKGFSRSEIKETEIRGLKQTIKNLMKGSKVETSEAAKDFLDRSLNALDNVKTLADLKRFRTSVGRVFDKTDPELNRAAGRIWKAATKRRNEIIKTRYTKTGPKNLRSFKNQEALKEIKKADEIYRNAIGSFSESLPNLTRKSSKPSSVIGTLENLNPTRAVDRIFDSKNVKAAQRLAKEFPEQFKEIRQFKLREIRDKATGSDGLLNPKTLIKEIRKFEPEIQDLFFDGNAKEKINAMETFLQSLPKKVGASDTPRGIDFKDAFTLRHVFGSEPAALGKRIFLDFISGGKASSKALDALARRANTNTTRALGFGAGKYHLDNPDREK